VPRGVGLPIAAKVAVRADVRANVDVQTRAPDVVVVPLQGAPVVEFFGIPLEGAQDVVFVLDCSGSMSEAALGQLAQLQAAQPPPPPPPVETAQGGVVVSDSSAPPPEPAAASEPAPAPPAGPTKIEVAKSELVDAISRLQAQTRLNVIFFNSGLRAYEATLFSLDDPSRSSLVGFIQGTGPEGSTALAPAMRAAFLMNARRVVLLSDGLGNVGGNAFAVLRDAREAMRGGVRIDTIGLGRGQDAELLGTLAGESGGLYQAL
jgi:hypothetical protein